MYDCLEAGSMKYVGAFFIVIGVLIQWNERRKNKAHVWLTNAIDGHIDALRKGQDSTKNLPDSNDEVPGSGLSFDEIKGIIDDAEKGAIGMTQAQLRKTVEDFENAERKQEPMYITSYVLVAVGTLLTVL
jgi:hypothetical protein